MDEFREDEEDGENASPIQPRRNRIRNDHENFWKIGNYLRIIALLGVIAYSIYIQSQAVSSNNWNSTRRNGFMQPNYCDFTMSSYDVLENYAGNGTQTNMIPIITHKPRQKECISEELVSNCMEVFLQIKTGKSVDEFTSFFNAASRSYFPYSTFVNVVSIISLLLTIMYESGDDYFLQDGGQFASYMDKRLVVRINILLSFTIGLMLIIAAIFQTFTYEEGCTSVYAGDDVKRYCALMKSCGLGLGSVIRPTNPAVLAFKVWMALFAATLILGLGFRYASSHVSERMRIQRVHPQYQLRIIRNHPHALVDPLDFPITPRTMSTRQGRARSTRRVVKPWKVMSIDELTRTDIGDCPICLTSLKLSTTNIFLNNEAEELASSSRRGNSHRNAQNSERGENAVHVNCEHVFHERCIKEWLELKDTCPVCRTPLVAHEAMNNTAETTIEEV